jgi:hypothetical protein
MKPTPEEWKEIEKELSTIYKTVELTIDDYKITLRLSQVGKLKLAIIVYVNGWIKAEYWRNDCEERRRFYHRSTIYIHRKKFRDAFSKLSKKMSRSKIAKATGLRPDVNVNATMEVYAPYWGSFRLLKAHLVKSNENIEWTNKPVKEDSSAAQVKGQHVR